MTDTADVARVLFEYRPTAFVVVMVAVAVAIALAVVVSDQLEQRRARREGAPDGYVDPARPRHRHVAPPPSVDLSSHARARRAAADRRRAGVAGLRELRLGEPGLGSPRHGASDAVRLGAAGTAPADEGCFQTTRLAAPAQRVEAVIVGRGGLV